MPWKETNVMEQRILFINAWLTLQYSKVQSRQHFEQGQTMPDMANPAFETIWQWDVNQG